MAAVDDPWRGGIGDVRAVAHDRHVKWNEPELAAHDETRGTRQAIEHPDTPFLYNNSGYASGEDMVEATAAGPMAVNPDHLRQRLGVVSTLQEAEAAAEREELERQANEPVGASLFELKRKALMDEQTSSLLKILSGQMAFDEEDDDDDADSATPTASTRCGSSAVEQGGDAGGDGVAPRRKVPRKGSKGKVKRKGSQGPHGRTASTDAPQAPTKEATKPDKEKKGWLSMFGF